MRAGTRVGMRVETRVGSKVGTNNYNLLYCLAQGKIACGCVMSIARLTSDIHAALGPGPSYFVFEGNSKSTDPHLSLNFRTERALAILSVTQITTGYRTTYYTSHDEFFFTEDRRRCISWDRTLNQWSTAKVSYKYFFSFLGISYPLR